MVVHVKDELKRKKKKKSSNDRNYLSTGLTTMNLAWTGFKNRGYKLGTYVNLPGSSNSGKTVLTMTAFAEAAKNPNFDHYEFILDAPEGEPDLHKFIGSKAARRINPPSGDKDDPQYSETIEQFSDRIQEACKRGSCIYVLDSSDVLLAEAGIKTEKDGKGTMGTEIAKAWSKQLKEIRPLLRKSKSILIIISQTRTNIGFTAKYNPDVRSGGLALKFHAKIEMWLKTIKRLEAGNRKDRTLGQLTKAKITKNHYNGWEGWVTFPIDRKYGIDDLRCCIQFLVDEGVWKESKKVIDTKDFGLTGKLEDLIQQIEFQEREEEVRDLVVERWEKIENSLKMERKKRYE